MNELHFENAFSSVPPVVHARIAGTLKEVKTMKKAKPIPALLLAAVLVMLLTGAAYAAVQSGVLAFLFRNSEPSPRQKEMVQDVGLSHESDGVTATVTDAVFDGRELSIGFMFHSMRNAYAVVDHVTINGVAAYRYNDSLSDMWLNRNPFASGEGDYAKGLSATIDPEYCFEPEQAALRQVYREIEETGHADISVGLSLLIPAQSLQTVDIYGDDTAAMWKAIDAVCAAGDTPISSDEPFELLTGSAFLGDEFRDSLPNQHPLDDADSYIQYSNMIALDRFTLDFSLDTDGETADLAQALKLNPPIDDGRLHVTFDTVRVTPFSTKISMSVTPREGTMTDEDIERIYRFFIYRGYDENGDSMPVEFQTKALVSSSAGFEEQPDGTLVYRIDLDLGPLVNRPAYIQVIPFNEESGADDPLWDYAIPVTLPQD